MTKESREVYIQWFEENNIPIIVDGNISRNLKYFILPKYQDDDDIKFVYIEKGIRHIRQIKNICIKRGYIPFALGDTDKENVPNIIANSIRAYRIKKFKSTRK